MNFKSSTSCRTGFHSTSAPHQLHPPPLLPPRPRPPVSATQNLRNLSVICCLLIGCSYHERDVALKHWSNSPHVCVILYVFDDELVFSISYMVSACHLFCCRSTFCAQRSAAPTSMKFIYIYCMLWKYIRSVPLSLIHIKYVILDFVGNMTHYEKNLCMLDIQKFI